MAQKKTDPELLRISSMTREDLETLARSLLGTTRQQKETISKLRNSIDAGQLPDQEKISTILGLAEFVFQGSHSNLTIDFTSEDRKWRLCARNSEGEKVILYVARTLADALVYWADQAKQKTEHQQKELNKVSGLLSKATGARAES